MRWPRLRRRKPHPTSGPLDCAAVAARLHEYLDAELTDHTTTLVNEHLEACGDCGLEVETYRAIQSSIVRGQRPDATALARLRDFAQRVTTPTAADES